MTLVIVIDETRVKAGLRQDLTVTSLHIENKQEHV